MSDVKISLEAYLFEALECSTVGVDLENTKNARLKKIDEAAKIKLRNHCKKVSSGLTGVELSKKDVDRLLGIILEKLKEEIAFHRKYQSRRELVLLAGSATLLAISIVLLSYSVFFTFVGTVFSFILMRMGLRGYHPNAQATAVDIDLKSILRARELVLGLKING